MQFNYWHKISRLGTTAKQDYPTRRRIIMVNQSALLGVLITLLYAIPAAFYSLPAFWPILALTPFLILGYAGVNWLNARCRPLLARILLLIVPSVHVSFTAWLFGNAIGIQLYFLGLWTVLFLLYSRREIWLSVVGGTLWIGLFLWVQLHFNEAHIALPGGSGFLSFFLLVNTLGAFAIVGAIISLFYLQIDRAERLLQREYQRSQELLENILPATIAARLKNGPQTIADNFSDVTLLFADIVGFTRLANGLSAHAVVALLNQIFSRFDSLVEQRGLEKIKTIGDEYMLAAGIPVARSDHAQAIAEIALEMLGVIEMLNREYRYNLALRIGIHSGEVVAGVIGSRKLSYDVWGDTVNIASRMQSQGVSDRIQVTNSTYELLKGDFEFERRGTLRVRGKGRMQTWFLLSKLA